ncbi:MAG TPA: 1-deoxy-D-xylulose-5-phosphate synthase N-terminal domain-containing protein, partial [Clostridia bacterium]|nr:1-deoxy-D-xylulose-5-phosphate synthase N-terminal domain-containing protein [Clostridia bacterium]
GVYHMSDISWQANVNRMAHGIRKRVLGLTLEKGGCYLSQALSSAEILATLYGKIMNMGPSEGEDVPSMVDPIRRKKERLPSGGIYHGAIQTQYDRFLISPAHYAAPVYAALVEAGRMASEGLIQFNTDGSVVEMIGEEHSPGFELTTGSFGQCISQAGGIASAKKLKGDKSRVFVFLSDGELQEGQTWEAMQALSFYKADNLVVYVDVNGQQVDGYTRDVMNIEPLQSRFEAFGVKCMSVNGHDVDALYIASLQGEKDKPLVVLCYTDPCHGIPLLERRKPKLHYVRIPREERPEFEAFYAAM